MKVLTTLLIVVGIVCTQAEMTFAESAIGKTVDNFSLKDFRGAQHSLSDFQDSKLVVVMFLGTECPLVKLYAPRLARMAEKYSKQGVTFLGINANRQDSNTEIAAYARNHGIKFSMLKDLGNELADRMGAVRTPEVFVLDQKRAIRYQGRIDDQFGVGYVRDKATQNDLETALDQLLAGKSVENSYVESVGCYIGRIRESKKDSKVTYSNQVARIFQNRCVECHREGEIAPFTLIDYDEVAGWAETIAEVIQDRRMPPWHADPKYGHFQNDRSMPEAEKKLVYEWVAAGAPQGDPKNLPEPREFVSGWSMPWKPDIVINVQNEPYTVPADSEVEYQYFQVDPGFTEDKWVKVSQILPGYAPVVHHVLCFVQPPGKQFRGGDDNGLGFLAAYVPGYRSKPFPKGMAKFVPAGSQLIFQVHYTPVGTVQKDQCKIGLVFADPKEITHLIQTVSAGNSSLAIPPHAHNYRAEGESLTYPMDLTLIALAPHMHLRGKSFRYEAVFPDGSRKTLLDVPNYDFNWQTNYELTEPMVLPAGTKMYCVAHWDNSEDNLNNPDPTVTVHWGDQTWEEMMIGFYDVAVPVDREKLLADGTIPVVRPNPLTLRDRAERLLKQFDINGDKTVTKDELPERMRGFFKLLDGDGNGKLSIEEAERFIKQRAGGQGGGERRGRRRGRRNRDNNNKDK